MKAPDLRFAPDEKTVLGTKLTHRFRRRCILKPESVLESGQSRLALVPQARVWAVGQADSSRGPDRAAVVAGLASFPWSGA